MVRTPKIRFLVVCGFEEVIETLTPSIWFIRVDLPTLGCPMSATNPACVDGSCSEDSVMSSYVKLLAVIFLVFSLGGACAPPEKTETAFFKEAETHYRSGDYEGALDGYESFLRLFPESPLAEMAELRIRTIRREVSSVLGRTDIPRPTYRGGTSEGLGAQTPATPTDSEDIEE